MLQIYIVTLVALFNLILALAVLSRNTYKATNIWFFALGVSSSAWMLGIVGFLLSESLSASLIWVKIYYLAALLIGPISVAFAQIFPTGRINRKGMALVFGIWLGFALLIISKPNFMFLGIVYHSWGKEVILNQTPYLIYGISLITMMVTTLTFIYRSIQQERGLLRAQAVVFFQGYIASSTLGIIFNLILPLFGNYRLIAVGPIMAAFYVGATAYSIIRHRFFNIRAAVARSVGYLLSIAALVAVYFGVTYLILTYALGYQANSTVTREVSASLAIVLAIVFRPIKRFFDRITNHLFYRDAYDLQVFVDRLNRVLVSTINLNNLLQETARLLMDTLKAGACTFIIIPQEHGRPTLTFSTDTKRKWETAKVQHQLRDITRHEQVAIVDFLPKEFDRIAPKLQADNIMAVAHMIQAKHRTNIGYVVLGDKKSGDLYSRQDTRALEIVANELMIAVQNALRFQQIENFNLVLQDRIEEATKKLRRTNEKLRMLDQTKDDFISMASHQLRTPLTSVKGYVSMVLDGDAGHITRLQHRLLNQAFISSQRMVYLISDLLNVSRLRTGKFIIEPVPTQMANIVHEEVSQLQETAHARGLKLTYHRPEHFPIYMLDETKMRQVVMNFVDNAIYYTPSGGSIDVTLTEKPESIEFIVTDNGIGVPRTAQHNLFTKFYRAPNAKRARPDGTGLGLFMAKKIIVAQGGAIIFKSREGHGSTFGFTFAKSNLVKDAKDAKVLHVS